MDSSAIDGRQWRQWASMGDGDSGGTIAVSDGNGGGGGAMDGGKAARSQCAAKRSRWTGDGTVSPFS